MLSTINTRLHIFVCNNNDKINLLIQKRNFNLLINPIGERETLECIGKALAYYDRTIDVIVTNDSSMINTIQKRYNIGYISTDKLVQYEHITIGIKHHISINNKGATTVLYQRPLRQLNEVLRGGDMNSILAPEVAESILSIVQQHVKITQLSKDKITKIWL